MLKYLNINGEDWCDTYQYLINTFLKTNSKNLYKRKYWKSTIMTIPYNAVWYKCFIKFLDSLEEDGIKYRNLSLEEKEDIKLTHKRFYNNIKDEIKKEFYKNENNKLMMFKYNKWQVLYKKEYKINYKKTREKYTDVYYMLHDDNKSTNRALEANNMHYLDAKLVKEILNNFEIISIHDCFGIRLCELHLIMDEINEYYSKNIGKETYSIHVII